MANKIEQRFGEIKEAGKQAFVAFVTAGDPNLEDLPEILDMLTAAGADFIEVGLPFSDPTADGPTIQASSQRALDRGVTTARILDALALAYRPGRWSPLIFMGYLNPFLKFGLAAIASKIAQVGGAGTIISDLSPELAGEWITESESAGLANIFLVAPTTTDTRIAEIASRASGFIYLVSRTGVTGVGLSSEIDLAHLVARIRKATTLPIAIGFGISNESTARAALASGADGIIVGSHIVQLLNQHWMEAGGRENISAELASLISVCK